MFPARRSETGRLGERTAAAYLERGGYRIVERNYRTREGEIDLIALDATTLVFCEVKTLVGRAAPLRGPAYPLEGVRPAKRRQVRRIARSWLANRTGELPHRYEDIRFDAVGVLVSTGGELLHLDHVRAAF